MPELIPAILAKSADEALQKLEAITPVASLVQLDVMDGHFVPNTTWYAADEFLSFGSTVEVELHLMVQDPEQVLADWLEVPSLKRVLWHLEIPVDHRKLIDLCREHDLECGLALSPKTPVSAVLPYLDDIDEVLLLGVEPGWSGQALIHAVLSKIDEIKQQDPTIMVGFDGGVDQDTIPTLVEQGVDRLYTASAIFKSSNPQQAFHELEARLHAAT